MKKILQTDSLQNFSCLPRYSSNLFGKHEGIGNKSGKVKVDDLVRVMVMQMNAFMVPYEAVRRRLVEVGLMQQSAADFWNLRKKKYYI